MEGTQGRGHLKSCLPCPGPALTGLHRAALGDPSSKGQGVPGHSYRRWHRLNGVLSSAVVGLRAAFAAGLCRGLARVPPACCSALSPAGLAERALCAQEVLDGGLLWGGGGMGCRNQDFRLSTPGLHFLCQSFPVNHFQAIRRGEEGCCSQQGGLQRYLLSFFCSNNSFLFLLLPLFPFLAQVSFCTFSLLPLWGSSALPLTPSPFL